jgi:SAM-dependent methyltransferase
MTQNPDAAPEAPEGVDIERPSVARVYDWYLGGNHNWAIDREFGKRGLDVFPLVPELCQLNREFLGRAVRAAMSAGIRQFLDLGSGVPTVGNVHEIVREQLPPGERAAVVYVDYEPVAVAHGTVLLEKQQATGWAGYVQTDLRDVAGVCGHETTKRLIDFSEPVCLLVVAALHFVGDDDRPERILADYQRKLAPGSWLALSHITDEGTSPDETEAVRRLAEFYRNTSNPMWLRNRADIESWLGGWPLLDPGLVLGAYWRPDRAPTAREAQATKFGWVGVAEKPG